MSVIFKEHISKEQSKNGSLETEVFCEIEIVFGIRLDSFNEIDSNIEHNKT